MPGKGLIFFNTHQTPETPPSEWNFTVMENVLQYATYGDYSPLYHEIGRNPGGKAHKRMRKVLGYIDRNYCINYNIFEQLCSRKGIEVYSKPLTPPQPWAPLPRYDRIKDPDLPLPRVSDYRTYKTDEDRFGYAI